MKRDESNSWMFDHLPSFIIIILLLSGANCYALPLNLNLLKISRDWKKDSACFTSKSRMLLTLFVTPWCQAIGAEEIL